jgi:hypothetical protein
MSKLVFTVGGVNVETPIDIKDDITISDFKQQIEKKIMELKNNGKIPRQSVMRSLIVGTTELLKEDEDQHLYDINFIKPIFKVDMFISPDGGSRRRKSKRSRKSRSRKYR